MGKLQHISALLLAGVLAGCGGSTDSNIEGTVSVSPANAQLLTCSSQKFQASVTGVPSQQVTWSADAALGSITDGGVLTTVTQASQPINGAVSAVSTQDPTVKGSTQVTVATAFPGAALAVAPGRFLDSVDAPYQHAIASSGNRVYAVFSAIATGSNDDLLLVRSDDGGKTWGAPVAVNGAGQNGFDCPAVAIDPVNPDLVYVSYSSGNGGQGIFPTPSGVTATGPALILATSTDGGRTFTNRPLIIDGNSGEPGMIVAVVCADVAAPSANSVVVLSPGNPDLSQPTWPDLELFVDANAGAGFDGTGQVSNGDFAAAGYSPALADATGDLPVIDNGGDEGPRLFTDGKGHVCATWIQGDATTATANSVWLSCSVDSGGSWSPSHQVDAATPSSPSSAAGSFAPDGTVVVAWTHPADANGSLELAWSHDFGASVTAPSVVPTANSPNHANAVTPLYDSTGILWLAYEIYDGLGNTTYVDKSCDSGQSWSGPVVVDGQAESASNGKHPTLAPGASAPIAADLFDSGSFTGLMRVFSLAP